MKLRLPAPAKVNLGLEVVGMRDDGLHDLVSILVNVELADAVELGPGSGTTVSGPYADETPADPGLELASRALAALEAEHGAGLGLALHVEKNIPVGAGLGGGSADAAAILRAAPALGVAIDARRLAEVALGLGADVPFQLLGGAALARGAGERLEALPIPEVWLAIAYPGIQVSTGRVFGALRPDDWGTGHAVESGARGLAAGAPPWAVSRLPNDLLAAVTREYPDLAEQLAALRKRGWDPRLTGTGSAVFQMCGDRAEAEALAVKTWDLGFRAWAVRTMAPPVRP